MIRSLIAVLLACTLGATSVLAGDLYEHNSSTVRLTWGEGDGFQIRYVAARPGLPVAPNTLLFHGAWVANGHIYGTAYVFSSQCGPVGYRVEGEALGEGYSFVVRGAAPIRDRRCNVVRHEWNDNATLYFNFIRTE